MKDYSLFLIDLDGTIYRGPDTIASGVHFVHRLQALGKNYLFLTNNTTRTPQMVVQKLKAHGIITDTRHVYTPSMATVSYLLLRHQQKTIGAYVIGEIGLWQEIFRHKQFKLDLVNPDYVIVGMDRDLTYRKLTEAADCIRQGAKFIGTNADLNLPTGNHLIPGNGAQCALLAAATGQEPLYIGKPAAIIVEMALEKLHCLREDALLVGDNYDTDIKAGFNSGVDQLLVLTGITKKSDLIGQRQPTYLVNDLDEVEL